jgi:hypothetical protein
MIIYSDAGHEKFAVVPPERDPSSGESLGRILGPCHGMEGWEFYHGMGGILGLPARQFPSKMCREVRADSGGCGMRMAGRRLEIGSH